MTDDKLSQFTILFVDDEEKTRKMFARLVSPHYDVLLAEDVPSAIDVLAQQDEGKVGVLLTDQRMPGQQGVDLLRHVRKEYPAIIRLLTTAYSDLEDAIDAVNMGEIFRYINKPWNIDELLIDLRLAMNFYELHRDRQMLISEKMSVSNRQAKIQAVKSLLYIAGAQTKFAQGVNAVASMLRAIGSAQSFIADNVVSSTAYWETEVQQAEHMIELNRATSILLQGGDSNITTGKQNQPINVSRVAQGIDGFILKGDEQSLVCGLSEAGMQSVLNNLNDLFHCPGSAESVISAEIEIEQHCLNLTSSDSSIWLAAMFSKALMGNEHDELQLIAKLIASVILVHQSGGELLLNFKESALTGISLIYPQGEQIRSEPDEFWLEDLFVLFG